MSFNKDWVKSFSFGYICENISGSMGVKKWVIVCSYVVVSIVLLMHSFIPHTHHDDGICFHHHHSSSHEQKTCCTYLGEQQEHNHGSVDNCNLDVFVIRPEVCDDNIPSVTLAYSLMYHFIPSLFAAGIDLPETDISFSDACYFLHYKSVYAGFPYSLRAPPMPVIA